MLDEICSYLNWKNMKFIKVIVLLFIITFYSCKENTELRFVKDPQYFNPAYRLTDPVGRKLVFSFHARYCVYGYNHNKLKFDSVVNNMVCKTLNGDTILSYISLSFMDRGRYNYYKDGEFNCSDFDEHISSIHWSIKNPLFIIESSRGETFLEKKLPFECNLKPEHHKIINRPDYRKSIPIKLKTKKYIFNHLDFKVMTYLSSMPINGIFAVSFLHTDDLSKISNAFEKAQGKWNKQTEQARLDSYPIFDRGKCNSIGFVREKNKIAYWHFDTGSAEEGIHEFLLKELSDSGIKIKSVEIQMI